MPDGSSVLPNLLSRSSYSIFKAEKATSTCSSFCNKNDNSYIKHPNVYDICCSINENLKLINLTVPNYDKVKYCRYFYYWMHEKVSEILKLDTENEYNHIMSSLEEVWDNTVKYGYLVDRENFKPVKDDMTMENVTKFKKLYEYYNEYNNVKEYINHVNSCKLYYSYLTSSNSLYKELEVFCSTTGSKCPEFFHGLKERLHQYQLSDQNSAFESSSPRNIIAVVFSLLGIFSIFIFGYKFTPSGFLLRKFISKKSKIKDYIDYQKEDGIVEDASQSEQTHSENSQYNVHYLSM
ncbi:PIR Superfamily Protein [Plasmodium ovale curtisi]|uniref:PIR Superfamily Protein n=1 Tax=Plasmodium ovale curtisi TaxID=864141 RepID=A0A1A8WE41_PLAOA|nr:PIR Superfamily Protein [Plasmodium ovale curtisi]